jgi:DNA topoisomerase-2
MSSIETKYQKLSQIEHILKRPGMYIGPVDPSNQLSWIYNKSKSRMVQKTIKYSQGLYKLFDEILMNALDETTRDKSLKNIKVDIDETSGKISVYNDGKGIDVVMHPKHKIYVPELIFSHLLTSTSYDSSKVSTAAGTHGLGAKLTAVFSKYFEVDIGDPISKKRFFQTYENSLSKKSTPKIEKYDKSDGYVKITFIPDYKLFSMDKLDKNHFQLIEKRTYDIAALSPENVTVSLNNQNLSVKSFSDYVSLYIGSPNKVERVIDTCGTRWKVIICSSINDKFEHISFVNGIYTSLGGRHVDYISQQINDYLYEYMKKKYKNLSIRESYIKDRYMLFIQSTIENPTFSSQTKEELTSPVDKFGSECNLSKSFYSKVISNLSIIDDIVNYVKAKEMRDLAGKSTKKKSNLRSIPKLDDANLAGTKDSINCTLILTEGDSAKTMAVSGISAIPKGRNIYGVFPLKGKLLNVRDVDNKKITNNEEISNLRKIIGFQIGKEYTQDNIHELRYGRIMIMTDADVDGSHIKGLIFNFLHHFFPTLLQVKGFVTSLVTPVVKVTKGTEQISFDNLSVFEDWKKKVDSSKWKIKYYKGLGTNTTQEAKEYFKNLEYFSVSYSWEPNTDKSIQLAFSKDKIEERKNWLRKYDKDQILTREQKIVSYTDFIYKELIHFSNYDNLRSIPSLLDGLKPSHRKVLFAGFKKNLTSDIKVSQFVGYISEHSAYHHGEMSLINTIIGMAQDFVGSNNIPLYVPSGQFGTRLLGGKDHSSARYIFTRLQKISRLIFHPHDDHILTYVEDDGMKVEPTHYMPIIPIILVNGTEGIGTGFSTYVPQYNAKDIIYQLQQRIERGEKESYNWSKMNPSYNNHMGSIYALDSHHYISKGKYAITDKMLEITELPVGIWSNDYKNFLEELVYGGSRLFSNLENFCTESKVHFVLKIVDKSKVQQMHSEPSQIQSVNNLEKYLKLIKPISLTNMYLYNSVGYLNKFENVYSILEEFYMIRLDFYKKRKDYLMKSLKNELDILDTKVKFISDIVNKRIDLSNKEKENIIKIFESKKFYKIKNEPDYDYLLRMPFYSLTRTKIVELNNQYKKKKEEYDQLNKKTPSNIWLEDLDTLLKLL